MPKASVDSKLEKKIKKLGIGRARRHIFLCADSSECGCASEKQMKESWKHLIKRLKQLKLRGRGGVLATRSRCFDVCKAGPIAVVYPDAVWYGRCTPEALDQIIHQHLVGGEVVEQFVIARGPQAGEEASAGATGRQGDEGTERRRGQAAQRPAE